MLSVSGVTHLICTEGSLVNIELVMFVVSFIARHDVGAAKNSSKIETRFVLVFNVCAVVGRMSSHSFPGAWRQPMGA